LKIETFKVKQYNSTYKHILVVDGKPVLITKGGNRMAKCIEYLTNKDVDISDGKIKKVLDEIMEENKNE